MCEITRNNFKEKLPEICQSLRKSRFISLDLEFSALHPEQDQAPRLFDNNEERYAKLRRNLSKVIPIQIGITAFHFDNDTNSYFGEMFTFYLRPSAFSKLDKTFYFQGSTMDFLCLHNFDFNKFAYTGIPYLNSQEESELRDALTTNSLVGENCNLHCEFDDALKLYVPIVNKWYNTCKINDFLEIPDINKKYGHYPEIVFFIHTHFRSRFKNLWTYNENDVFVIKIVSDEELIKYTKADQLKEHILDYLTGFRQIFKLLTSLKKPIIGHNLLQDLMILINNFETKLPNSYSQFKQLTHQLFPSIFDTKTLYYELRPTIPKEKLPDETSLEVLFRYFKDGLGRQLVLNTSVIECNIEQDNFHLYHNAGWDSFCAGYVFIRIAYYNISLSPQFSKSKEFVCSEIINGLSQYKNCVNVIRGATSHVRIDGVDPTSNRPPWLVVESLKNEPLDVNHLISLMSCYGFVDVKKLTSKGNRVLVAVDTFRAAREISRTFGTSQKFQVRRYSIWRHSPVARFFLVGAIAISGTMIWFTRKFLKR